jgi:hypothetical protein
LDVKEFGHPPNSFPMAFQSQKEEEEERKSLSQSELSRRMGL